MPARILVIEDNAPNLELMTYLLKAFGHTTLVARDGRSWSDDRSSFGSANRFARGSNRFPIR